MLVRLGNGDLRRGEMSQATGTKATPIAGTSKEISQNEPTTEQIRQRAYEIYLSRGGAPGDEFQDWLQAESELRLK